MDGVYRMSSTRRERIIRLLSRSLQRQGKDTSVLDIGFGGGEVGKYCKENAQGKSIYTMGIDIAPKQIDLHGSVYDSARVVNVDEEGWTDSLGRSFDIVIASELLEHLFRPDLFLARVKKILTPSGEVIITTPNFLLWSKRIKFLFGIHEYSDGGVFEWGHIHLCSWKFLNRIIRENGYEIVDSDHLLHPNALNPLAKILSPGLFAFQFILTIRQVKKV
jgi:SAM-dependent methyltransferase